MPGRTSSRHSPSTRCRWLRRPVSSHPIQASRARRRRAHAANPTPPSQPCAEPTRYRSCGPTNGPAPRGCSCAISVFRPGAARRSPPAPTSGSRSRRPCQVRLRPAPPDAAAHARGVHRRQSADLEAARRALPPPPGRPIAAPQQSLQSRSDKNDNRRIKKSAHRARRRHIAGGFRAATPRTADASDWQPCRSKQVTEPGLRNEKRGAPGANSRAARLDRQPSTGFGPRHASDSSVSGNC